jgi:fused signal recognition particle receptor
MEMYVAIGLVLLVLLLAGAVALLAPRRRRPPAPPEPGGRPETGAAAGTLAPPERPETLAPPETAAPPAPPAPVEVPVETPEPTAGRLVRLRSRLSRSQNVFGKSLLALLSRDKLDDDTWDEVEEILITADVGVAPTTEIVGRLRERARVLGTSSASELRKLLTDELVEALDPSLDRSLSATPHDGRPAVLLVVGVNGSAAAVDQLTTWAGRVGAEVVRGPEGADPASVAFDAVKRGTETGVDSVLVDTAGRLQNKVGLMDELGKVKRVIERHGPVDETLLVLDATTGQNGLEQARVFTEVVDVTGVVLTKLDGTAKGGIVIAVQRQLGIPVKLVGLGEGADDLAPFEPAQFVDALLGAEA